MSIRTAGSPARSPCRLGFGRRGGSRWHDRRGGRAGLAGVVERGGGGAESVFGGETRLAQLGVESLLGGSEFRGETADRGAERIERLTAFGDHFVERIGDLSREAVRLDSGDVGGEILERSGAGAQLLGGSAQGRLLRVDRGGQLLAEAAIRFGEVGETLERFHLAEEFRHGGRRGSRSRSGGTPGADVERDLDDALIFGRGSAFGAAAEGSESRRQFRFIEDDAVGAADREFDTTDVRLVESGDLSGGETRDEDGVSHNADLFCTA